MLPARGLARRLERRRCRSRRSGSAAQRGCAARPRASTARSSDAEAEVEAGGEPIGYALALAADGNGMPQVRVDREEVLRTAALAAIAEVAVADARDELAADVRGSLLEDLRARRADAGRDRQPAARLGCDLAGGAVALVAEIDSSRPRHAAALITGEHPGAIAEPLSARRGRLAPRLRDPAGARRRGRRRAGRGIGEGDRGAGFAPTAPLPSPPSAPSRPSSAARSPRPS